MEEKLSLRFSCQLGFRLRSRVMGMPEGGGTLVAAQLVLSQGLLNSETELALTEDTLTSGLSPYSVMLPIGASNL